MKEETHALRHRRWLWVVVAIVAVVLVSVGGAVAWMWGGRGAREASIDKAVDQFRRAPARSGNGSLRPVPGVYTYLGSGTEQLSLLGAHQEWGPHIPATVTATDPGCWRFRVEYNDHHVQELDFCARTTTLVVTGGRIEQRFDFGGFTIDDAKEFVCEPPGVTVNLAARVGGSWRYSCISRNAARRIVASFTDTYVFLGRRHLSVGGRDIETYAYRVERSLHGNQSGREHNELWFATSNGLPVRVRRDAHLNIPTQFGTVSYTERGTFALTSVIPHQ